MAEKLDMKTGILGEESVKEKIVPKPKKEVKPAEKPKKEEPKEKIKEVGETSKEKPKEDKQKLVDKKTKPKKVDVPDKEKPVEKINKEKPVEKTVTKPVKPSDTIITQKPIETKSKQTEFDMKMFGIWSSQGLKVSDPGLKGYISLKPVVVPRTGGRHGKKQFYKSKISLVERLMNHLFVPGHRGKKHLLSSGKKAGKTSANWKIMKDTLRILEQRTKTNPLQVLITAIENAALREEVTSFQVGGIMARKAVITSPQRRIDLAMRLIAQTSSKKAHSNPKGTAACLADELLGCYNKDSTKSVAIKEKERIEREATGSR